MTDSEIQEKLFQIRETMTYLAWGRISEFAALYRISTIVCPRPKPTKADIEWAIAECKKLEGISLVDMAIEATSDP